MKVLCLHGAGLNASIMERQMAGIIDALGPDYDFVFIDGEVERRAAPGVPAGIDGPFYTYHNDLRPESIRAVCDLIDVIVEEEGPFDGFMGFSQGAAAGVSYIMDKGFNAPNQGCPFRWIVLFSCPLALSPDGALYELEFELRNILHKKMNLSGTINKSLLETRGSKLVRSVNRQRFMTDPAALEALEDDYYALSEAFAQSADNEREEGVHSLYQDALDNPSTENALVFYHPGMTSQRIPVPSVHCVGKNDMYQLIEQSKMIRDLCDEGDTISIEHSFGHDIPRDSLSTQAIAKAIRQVIEDSHWKAQRSIC
jgi:hypothetical protein